MEINGFLIGLYGYGLFMANVKYFLACSVLNYILNIQKSGYPRSPLLLFTFEARLLILINLEIVIISGSRCVILLGVGGDGRLLPGWAL